MSQPCKSIKITIFQGRPPQKVKDVVKLVRVSIIVGLSTWTGQGVLLLMGYTKLLTLVGGVNINMQHGAFNKKIHVYEWLLLEVAG